MPMLTEAFARAAFDSACRNQSEFPDAFSGRGIVIPAGGHKYFPCAYVNICMLRRAGCTLPIELWFLGEAEMNPTMHALVRSFGVTCVDALSMQTMHPARCLNGYELKAYSVVHSSFVEIVLLDADNVPVVDPTFLFDSPEYLRTGAIFWPDYCRLAPHRSIWKLTGVEYRDEPEFESGEIVVDKRRCWRELCLALWMNENSDFWYQHIHGDKDTFHFAWRKLGREYAMPSRGIESLQGVMCQHDFQGRRIFQHRNTHKFTLDVPNARIAGFLYEDECVEFLHELDSLWHDRPTRPYSNDRADSGTEAIARALCSSDWLYLRIGYDDREMKFGLDGRVAIGAGECERTWNVVADGSCLYLFICGRDGITCRLRPDGPKRWTGQWLIHEQMPVELLAPP